MKTNKILEYTVELKNAFPSFLQATILLTWKTVRVILLHSFSTGQILVIGDTLVNIKLKINRLDNYYMLLVPINLIAFFYKVGDCGA